MTITRISEAFVTTNPADNKLDTMSEVILTGDPSSLRTSIAASNFTCDTLFVGKPHHGYDHNCRENTASWSMQVNTNANPANGPLGASIDIDHFNPNGGWGPIKIGTAALHLGEAGWDHFRKTDTNQSSVANALGVELRCTGGQ